MGLTFEQYQQKAFELAIYPEAGKKSILSVVYTILGLTGEAGEVAEKIKKAMRDDGGVILPEKREAVKKELGDVLWYLSALAKELGISLEDVAQTNIDKLTTRKNKDCLHGSGDNREL